MANDLSLTLLRCSTKDQSPELQLKDISALSPPSDLVIYTENVSAWKKDAVREEFNKILKLIKQRKVKALYVWDLDRLFRNRIKLVEFLRVCRMYGTKVYSFNQTWMQTMQNTGSDLDDFIFDLLLQVMGWVGESESSLKSKRVKLAVRRKEEGTYSYLGNKWGRKPISKLTTEKILQLHKEGASIRDIAKFVTINDKNNNSRLISKSAVHKLISKYAIKNVS